MTIPTRVETIDPILRVEDMRRSVRYYVDVLGFREADWGTDDFSYVGLDGRGIYLCRGGQGRGRAWVWVGVEDVRALHRAYRDRGAVIRGEPAKGYTSGEYRSFPSLHAAATNAQLNVKWEN